MYYSLTFLHSKCIYNIRLTVSITLYLAPFLPPRKQKLRYSLYSAAEIIFHTIKYTPSYIFMRPQYIQLPNAGNENISEIT